MANVYDSANDLATALRESDDFKQLKELYDAVNNDEAAKGMFDRFRDMQMSLQAKQMQGENISEEEVQRAQQTVQLVQQNEKISKLMEVEQRLGMIINELNQIIMKPLEELYGSENVK